jgi:hypothetical protein
VALVLGDHEQGRELFEALDLLGELVAELGRLRVAVEVLAGEALDRAVERESREASVEAHPSLGIPPEYE